MTTNNEFVHSARPRFPASPTAEDFASIYSNPADAHFRTNQEGRAPYFQQRLPQHVDNSGSMVPPLDTPLERASKRPKLHSGHSSRRSTTTRSNDVETVRAPPSCLTTRQLRAERDSLMNRNHDEVCGLLLHISDCSEILSTDPLFNNEGHVRVFYRVWDLVFDSMNLAQEWGRLLELRPMYLSLVPPEIQQEFAAIMQQSLRDGSVAPLPSLRAFVRERNEHSTRFWDNIDRFVSDDTHDEDNFRQNHVQPPPFARAATLSETGALPNLSSRSKPSSGLVRSNDHAYVFARRPNHHRNSSQSGTPTAGNSSLQPVAASPLPSQLTTLLPTNGQRATTATSVGRPPTAMIPVGQRRGLRPEKGTSIWPYEWSLGRKRAWLELTHQGERLPPEATKEWHNFLTTFCTSEHADIRLLGAVPTTAVEILSLFPEHVKWRAIGARLENAGWKAGDMREYILWSRQLGGTQQRSLRRSAMSRQSTKAKNWVGLQHNGQVNSASGWTMQGISNERVMAVKREHGELSDYFLVDLAEGLVKFPEGDDRGILTVAVDHALKHGHDQVKLSEISSYIQQEHLSAAQLLVFVTNADTAARRRHFPTAGQNPSDVQLWWEAGGFIHD